MYGRKEVPVSGFASCSHICQPVPGFRSKRSSPRTRAAQQVTSATATIDKPQTAAAPAASLDWSQLAQQMDSQSPLQIIDHALATFGDEVAIAFSGAEDVAVIEYAHLTGRPFRVFSLDTGRLDKETYELFDRVERHYNIRIEYTFPDAQETMDLVRAKGMFSFYQDGHQECCRVRKVRPLRRQLKTLKAWITGQRRDQSPGTRAAVSVVQVDPAFEGTSGGPGSLVKYNPLAGMTGKETWNFLRVMDVPVNELHSKGYVSIGCQPCTRPVLPNQHEREGRWWWEDAAGKECGLHSGNVSVGSAEQGSKAEAQRDLWPEGKVQALSQEELSSLACSESREQDTLVALYAPWCQYSQAMEGSYSELAEQYAARGSHVRIAKFQADTDREFSQQTFGLQTFPTIVMLPKSRKQYIRYPSERRDVETLDLWIKSVVGQ
ncbi:hypothetical protein WJX84_003919 [Apatococcus fuscideae]|uniref:Thioredoxin domain-containing protein n=1 Tax=Apatococcus fuscideae TaxID=2026836 RepID=A0AAW1T5I8_9CHLO